MGSLARGFLQKKHESLYGPDGSAEGVVAPEAHKAHAEHKMNESINGQMNRGAKDNNHIERPPWYTSDWPKDCQYNSPGCALGALDESKHASDLHKRMVRDNERWLAALAPRVTCMRLSFMQACDEDLTEIIACLRGNMDVTELDLSHNNIKDRGVQELVAALSSGAAPNLLELRIHSNEFGELGTTMLTKGLPIFRKKLTIACQDPAWSVRARASRGACSSAPTSAQAVKIVGDVSSTTGSPALDVVD